MSIKSKKICDRCGAEINGYGNTALALRKFAKLNFRTIFGFGPYDYSDESMDLCCDCTKKLEKFLSGRELEKDK